MNQPRIAVIGSGPSGLYTVAALLASGHPLHVVYASGTEKDRRLGIPGEQLPGVVGSGEFVR